MATVATGFAQANNIGGVAVAGNAQTTIQLATERTKIRLWTVAIKRSAGASATAFTPYVTNVTGAASTVIGCKWIGSSTAAGTLFGVTAIDRPMYTDANGYIYLTVGGDAADSFEYELWYEVIA